MRNRLFLNDILAPRMTALLSATSQEEFFGQLCQGQQEVQAAIPLSLNTPARQRWLEEEVSACFQAVGSNQRQRRALEALLLPTTATLMPLAQEAGVPEYLWTFCLPVRLTFSPEQLDQVTVLHGDFVPVEMLLYALEKSGAISDKAILGGYSSLYRREDLFAYGPLALAQSFADADLHEEFEPPHPLPIILDSGLPANATVTCLVLMSARLPLGERTLFNRRILPPDTRQVLEQGLRASLTQAGIEVDAVEVDQLSHLHEMYLHSGGPLARELQAHLENIKSVFGEDSKVVGRIPAPGYFELNVVDSLGSEHLGIAALPTLEPAQVLRAVLEKLCERTETALLTVTTASAVQLSPQLH